MAYDGKIYRLRDSAVEGQPYIDLSEHPWTWIGKQTKENKWGDWNELLMTFPEGVDTFVSEKRTLISIILERWSGTTTATVAAAPMLISQRVKDLLGDYLRAATSWKPRNRALLFSGKTRLLGSTVCETF